MVSLCNEGWCRLLKLDYQICLTRNILSSVSIVYFLIALVHLAQFNIFYHINLGGRSIHRQVIRSGWRRLLQQRGDSEGLMLDRVRSAIGCRFFEASDPRRTVRTLESILAGIEGVLNLPFQTRPKSEFSMDKQKLLESLTHDCKVWDWKYGSSDD